MNKNNKSHIIAYAAALILIGAAVVISICIGKYPISVEQIIAIILNKQVPALTRSVFLTLRVPRTLMAVVAGIGLGVSGSVYQTVFKNPLASPDIIGISNGANLGAAAAIVLIGSGTYYYVAGGAFLGSILAVAMVFGLAQMTKVSNTATFVLAGIVINQFARAMIMIFKYFSDSDQQLASIEYWTMGSLSSITMNKLIAVFPVFAVSMVGLILMRRYISMMALDDDECRALGVSLKSVRFTILGLTTLIVASVVSVTGMITFVGLISPHIARLVLKRNSFSTCIYSGLCGAFILLVSDMFARSLYYAELPISILTTFVGIPFLIYFMCNKGGRA